MGRESGLYISEKEQLTNIHICLNVRQNVCALDEQNEGDLIPSIQLHFQTPLPYVIAGLSYSDAPSGNPPLPGNLNQWCLPSSRR